MRKLVHLFYIACFTSILVACDKEEDQKEPTKVKFEATSTIIKSETDGTFDLVVQRTGNADAATTVDIALVNGSAADFSNYTTQTVTFPAGSNDPQKITVTITNDNTSEPTETFTFALQNVSGGEMPTIDQPSTVNVEISDVTTAMDLSGTITSNMTLRANVKYTLRGFVYVQAPAVLTIEPGTIIKGGEDPLQKGSLIIERGAQIMANGTVEKPIVFTSSKPKGQRAAGDWGGLIILGRAPVNLPGNPIIEGGVDRPYGGTAPADNSGTLRYVRIEYSGVALNPGNEINGLTLGGVGSGTTIDYVQVSFNGDDSFEFFGGTVNAKHLIAYKTVDDMFDTDNGYSGKLQFLVGLSSPTVADASGSNGFESDNDANGSALTPQTSAIFSNVSLFGPKATASTTVDPLFASGMHIRRNSSISVHNSLVAGWPRGLLLDGTLTQNNFTGAEQKLKIRNTVIAGSGTALNVNNGSTLTVDQLTAAFNTAGWGNELVGDNATLNITNAFTQSGGAPDFRPGTGSSLLTGASFTGMDPFFENVTYKGAFGTENWTTGWANFDPQNADY